MNTLAPCLGGRSSLDGSGGLHGDLFVQVLMFKHKCFQYHVELNEEPYEKKRVNCWQSSAMLLVNFRMFFYSTCSAIPQENPFTALNAWICEWNLLRACLLFCQKTDN